MRHVSVQQLSAYRDHALAGVSRELVRRHLAACAACRERYERWRANDEALLQLLSWEPDEQTFERWSTRVELTITAERKGLPAPEFEALQHVVIARSLLRAPEQGEGALEAPAGAGDEAGSVRRPEDTASPEPEIQSDAGTEPVHAPAGPEAASEAASESEVAPSEPGPSPVISPEAGFAPGVQDVAPEAPKTVADDEEPAGEVEAEFAPAAQDVEPATPDPVVEVDAQVGCAETDATIPSAGEVTREILDEPVKSMEVVEEVPASDAEPPAPDPTALPPEATPSAVEEPEEIVDEPVEPMTTKGPSASQYPPQTEPIAVVPPARSVPGSTPRLPHVVTQASRPITRRPRLRRRRVKWPLALASLVLTGLVGLQFLPDVIRIPVPDLSRWRPRLPRVEFVPITPAPRESAPAPARESHVSVASRVPVVAERVLPAPRPVPPREDSALTTAKSDGPAPGLEDATWTTAAPTSRPDRPEPREPSQQPPTEPHARNSQASASSRTVDASPAAPASKPPSPASAPAQPAAQAEGDEEWPLLCGEVVDASGAPIEGALATLVSPSLAVRTDRRGRFCISCPPGARTLRIEASGYIPATRSYQLNATLHETRIKLVQVP